MLHEPLTGKRVRLEPLEPRHEEPLWEAAQDERTFRFFQTRANESREAFHDWFELVLGDWLPFATVVEGKPLGSTSYGNVREKDRVVEIGNTWLAPEAWGTGANTEAKLLMLRHAFEDERFLRVEFKTESTNERSRAALAALPAQFEGIARRHMVVRGGERRDSAWYAVIDDDWPSVKANLLGRLAKSASPTSAGVASPRK
jgi:N-acetyltransferase